MSPVPKTLQLSAHEGDMRRIGGADKVIVPDVQLVPRLPEALGIEIAVRLRRQAAFLRGLLHFLAVLVGSGEKENLVAQKLVVARQDVRQYRGIGVADVRNVVDVIDGRGDVKGAGHKKKR